MENKPAADNSFYDVCMTGGCHQGLLWNVLFIHWNIFHPKLMFAASTSAGLAGWQKSRPTEITHKQLSRWGERRETSVGQIFSNWEHAELARTFDKRYSGSTKWNHLITENISTTKLVSYLTWLAFYKLHSMLESIWIVNNQINIINE